LRALSGGCRVQPAGVAAWLLGDEAARWFRWLVDRVVSRSDSLFSVAMSDAGSMRSHRGGLGLLDRVRARDRLCGHAGHPMVGGRALSWLSVALVLTIWLGIRLVWTGMRMIASCSPDLALGWRPIRQRPYAGSLGFFVGFSAALVLAATPWRYKPPTL